MESRAEAPLRVGDLVVLLRDFPTRKALRAGRQGVVLLSGEHAPWGLVSVQFGRREGEQLYQLHPRHLRRVSETAPSSPAERAQ
jgi:hypothetical protein